MHAQWKQWRCHDGLKVATQLRLQRVSMETDSLELIHLWKETQRSIIDPVLKEIDELRLAFQDFSFSHVSRKL
jgi:hypothetical protein